jgi:hypothetical protein
MAQINIPMPVYGSLLNKLNGDAVESLPLFNLLQALVTAIASITAVSVPYLKESTRRVAINYSPMATDCSVIYDTGGGARTGNLPDASAQGSVAVGGVVTSLTQVLFIYANGANTVTLSALGGQTVNGGANIVIAANTGVILQSDGVNAWFGWN